MNYIDDNNYNNDNYSRVRLFLYGIIIAVLFLIGIFLMCTGFHLPDLFPSVPARETVRRSRILTVIFQAFITRM